MRVLSVLRRMTAVTAACLLLAGATGLPHERAADHDGDRAHLEIPHGGHSGVIDLPTERIRSHAPEPIPSHDAPRADDGWPGSALTETEPTPERMFEPPPRPPPRQQRPRAPPLS